MSTVVTQPYSLGRNGGRKLVRLQNGKLYSLLFDGPNRTYLLYEGVKSVTNEIVWTQIKNFIYGGALRYYYSGGSIATDGKNLFVALPYNITSSGSSHGVHVHALKEDGGWYQYTPEDVPLVTTASMNEVIIECSTNEVHLAWLSIHPDYSKCINIRYTRAIITSGAAMPWEPVEQITKMNSTGIGIGGFSLGIRNNTPYIIFTTVGYYLNGTTWQGISGSISGVSIVSRNSLLISGNVAINSNWSYQTFFNTGTGNYPQYNPSTIYVPPSVTGGNGRIWVAWDGTEVGYGNPIIRAGYSDNGGATWTVSHVALHPTANYNKPSITADKDNVISVVFSRYAYSAVCMVKNINDIWGGVTDIVPDVVSTPGYTAPSVLYDNTFTIGMPEVPPVVYENKKTSSITYIGSYTVNNAPTVTLTSPSNNQTLYENDALNIAGEAYDSDKDQSVTVYYQVNNEPRKVLATNLSQTQISLSKQLTFKGSKLFDGEVAITGVLADGVAHILKVWAVDSEGGQSTTVERTFYVVPNRAPILSVETPTPSGIIDADSFTINGLYEDSDGNQTTISYRINGSNAIQVASGVSGPFSFEVKLGSLITGDNIITVEAVDSYGAKTTKSVKLSKSIISAPLLKSTARYKIMPPTGTASEILVWVQHDAELTLSASVSMTIAGEQESYAPMTLSNSEILQSGQVEDEFYYAADGAKDSVILRLDLTKSNVNTNEAITLITGVF